MTYHEVALKASSDWFAYQNVLELETALQAVDLFHPNVILEIGTAHAGSLAAWCEVVQPELAIGLDPLTIPRTPKMQTSFDNLVNTYNIKLIPHMDDDPRSETELIEILGDKKVDFMFIDAAHDYPNVKYDFENYKKYLSPHALVGFHDIFVNDTLTNAGSRVGIYWNEIKEKYNYDEFYSHSSMGIGLLYINQK